MIFSIFPQPPKKIKLYSMLKSSNLITDPPNCDEEFFPEFKNYFKSPETCDFSFNCLNLEYSDNFIPPKEENNVFNSKQWSSGQEYKIDLSAENLSDSNDLNKSNESIKELIFFNEKSDLFKVQNIKNKGRKSKLKKKCHRKEALDNIMTKTQVHFMNFFINVSNDVLRTICNNNYLHFKQINYTFKKKISFEHLSNLKKSPIKELLKVDISQKYKKSYQTNYEIYSLFASHNEFIKNFFNMNYLALFKIYYNNCKPLKKIVFEGKEILLSRNTKDFYSLLRKERIMKEKIISAVNDVYFNGNIDSTEKFIVTKISEKKNEESL